MAFSSVPQLCHLCYADWSNSTDGKAGAQIQMKGLRSDRASAQSTGKNSSAASLTSRKVIARVGGHS
jgi:hypothetical protein